MLLTYYLQEYTTLTDRTPTPTTGDLTQSDGQACQFPIETDVRKALVVGVP